MLYTGAFPLISVFSDNIWPTLLYHVNCSGHEATIWECQYTLQQSPCRYDEDAAVVCQSNIIVDLIYM